jgi:cell division transport system permease protein
MPGVDAVIDLSRSSDRPTIPSCSAKPEAADGRTIHLDGRSAYVYLTQDATDAQREAIAAELRSLSGVANFSFSDREDAYERFKRVYACAPELIDATRPESLPESFLVTPGDPASYPALQDKLTGMPGIDTMIQIK